MTQGLQSRLRRLEKRRPQHRFAHLTDEQLQLCMDDLLVRLVAEVGLEQARASVARACTPETLARIDVLRARGRIPAV